MGTFGIRVFHVVILLFCFGAFRKWRAAASSFGLCDFKEVITARNGSIVASKGSDCTRVILAPLGRRIKFTLEEIDNKDAITYIYDGAKRTGTLVRSFGKGEALGISMTMDFYTTSNALLVHTDKISSQNSKFRASFELLPNSPADTCSCLPTVGAQTTCSFSVFDTTGIFYHDEDELKKECTASCDTGRRLIRRGSSVDMRCKYSDTPDPTWELKSVGTFLDENLISCTKVIPATQVVYEYKLTYPVSCDKLDKSAIENGINGFLVSSRSHSYVGECFKDPRNNCTAVKPVLATCVETEPTNVKVEIRDNVQTTQNETETRKLFNIILASNIQNEVKNYALNNLTANDTTATQFELFDEFSNSNTLCPDNYVLVTGEKSCVSCPLHTSKAHFRDYIFHCQICLPSQRRLHNESSCVDGIRDYPKPSNAGCLHKCAVGKFFHNESGICDWCDYGYFQNSTSALNPVCHPCPAGNTTSFVGATSEKDCMYQCRKGQFANYPSCFNCSHGYYMPYQGNRYPQCYKCPPGKTTLTEGAVNQTDCINQCTTGKYFNTTLRRCMLCPNNTYQDESAPGNKRSCKMCPPNTVTLSMGAESISKCYGPCSMGEYLDIKLQVPSCKQCPLNMYNDKGNQTYFMCMACPTHKITKTEGAFNASQCIYTCSKGEFFNKTSEACEKCRRNTFQDEDGQDFCKPCVADKFTLKNGSRTCLCKRGEFLDKSAEICQQCPVGYFQSETNHLSTKCMPCPLDYYTDEQGAHNCTACPNREITVMVAAKVRSDCIERCGRGYYLDKALRSCQMCLQGSYQDQAGYRNESCVKCASANPTTLASGAESADECVGYCALSPCRNGANCTDIDGSFNCTCPNHLSGKRCENITDYYDANRMEIQVTFPALVWNSDLSNPDSGRFMQLANEIENAIRDGFKSVSSFRTVKVNKFTRGSVVSDLAFFYVPGVEFSNPLDSLAKITKDGKLGNLTVNSSSLSVVNFTCRSPLGMENGRIPDSSLTSANSSNIFPFTNARLNHNGPGWTPNRNDAYLQIDFGEVLRLTGIATQGSSYGSGHWLITYYFSYSKDDKAWLCYKENKTEPYKVGL